MPSWFSHEIRSNYWFVFALAFPKHPRYILNQSVYTFSSIANRLKLFSLFDLADGSSVLKARTCGFVENDSQKEKISKSACWKGTSLAQTTSFESPCVEIGCMIWAVDLGEKKYIAYIIMYIHIHTNQWDTPTKGEATATKITTHSDGWWPTLTYAVVCVDQGSAFSWTGKHIANEIRRIDDLVHSHAH